MNEKKHIIENGKLYHHTYPIQTLTFFSPAEIFSKNFFKKKNTRFEKRLKTLFPASRGGFSDLVLFEKSANIFVSKKSVFKNFTKKVVFSTFKNFKKLENSVRFFFRKNRGVLKKAEKRCLLRLNALFSRSKLWFFFLRILFENIFFRDTFKKNYFAFFSGKRPVPYDLKFLKM